MNNLFYSSFTEKLLIKLFLITTGPEEKDSSSYLIDVECSTSNQASQQSLHQNTFSNNMSTHHNTSMFQMSSNFEFSGL